MASTVVFGFYAWCCAAVNIIFYRAIMISSLYFIILRFVCSSRMSMMDKL
ncbi:hypothetical protein D088_820088 [Salmonella enterica subsp. houtenae serovar 16:z4,z32:-- str. RKS3027]|nr:hypothetical protein D088_820088 [Salmonella enterica subsp. houtenae serovar 16:z4,z32:-- str. RKS3027]